MSAPDAGAMSGQSMVVGLVSTGVAGALIFYATGSLDSLTSMSAVMVGAQVAVAGVAGAYLASYVNKSWNY